jgi:hypothetical protein
MGTERAVVIESKNGKATKGSTNRLEEQEEQEEQQQRLCN